jgi:hypothetical protein
LYQLNKTLLQYYQYYPKEQENPDLEEKIGGFQRRLFNQAPLKYYSREFKQLEYYVLGNDYKTFKKLVSTLKNVNQFRLYHSELNHLFQMIECLGNQMRYDLTAFKKEEEFQKSFDLMDSSTQFLGRLENIRIYLQTKFTPNQNQNPWIKSIFDQPNHNHLHSDTGPLEELELIAKYIKIIEAEHNQTTDEIFSFNSLHMYCQRDLIKQSIAHLKLLLIDCASSF